MSITADLLDGVGQILATAGIATYRGDGSAYQSSETAVVFALMPQAPDRVVCLTDYTVADDAGNPWTQVRVQVRTRGLPDRPDDTWALRDAVYNLIQATADLTFGAVTVAQVLRVSSIPLGVDANRRFEYADNYALDVQLPATVNRPA